MRNYMFKVGHIMAIDSIANVSDLWADGIYDG